MKSFFKPDPNDFSSDTYGRRGYLWGLLRYTFWLIFFFIFIFGISFVYFLKENPTHQMIDLRGRDILEAVEWLQKRSLNPIISERIDPAFPRYQVIEQNPAPGTPVKENRSVSLVVSFGQNELIMPNFRGSNYTEARQSLLTQLSGYEHIPLITKVEKYSDLPEGLVTDHYPHYNQPINLQERLIFVVSRGIITNEIIAEDYTFQEYQTVEKNILSYGIRVNAEYVPVKDPQLAGKIVSQDIPKDSPMNPGNSIRFIVGYYDPEANKLEGGISKIEILRLYQLQVPVLSTLGDFTKKLDSGEVFIPSPNSDNSVEKYRSVQIKVTDQTGSKIIFNETLPSGKKINIPYRTVGQGSLQVIIDGEIFDTISFN